MERIDATGLPCPMPVVKAKNALKKNGSAIVVIKVDNFIAVQNLEKMAIGNGYGFSFEKTTDVEYNVTLSGDNQEAHVHPAPQVSGVVVIIGSNEMGSGSEQLGKILMKSFIYSLTELIPKIEAVIFFNTGAFLSSYGSNTVDDLQLLIDSGCRILTCGTCIDFYQLPPPAVGEVANMFEIVTLMTSAEKIISP